MTTGRGRAGHPRSVADDLRRRTEQELTDLLLARHDLALRPPATLGALAEALSRPASIARTFDDLDAAHLLAATAAALCPDPVTPADVAGWLGASAPDLLADLWASGLAWGTRQRMHLLRGVRDLAVPSAGPLLGGICPEVAGFVADPGSLHALLERAPEGAGSIVATLVAGRTLTAHQLGQPGHGSALSWLTEHRIVVAVAGERYVLPAEVALLLRGRTPPAQHVLGLEPPSRGHPTDAAAVGRAAASQALTALDTLDELADQLAAAPPECLRTGGLGVRDGARLAAALGVPVATVRLLLEVGGQAGLIGIDRSHNILLPGVLLPTADLDRWRGAEPATRWGVLALAWLRMPRRTHTINDEARAPHILGPDVGDGGAPHLRRMVLGLGIGAGALTMSELLALVSWHQPRRFTPNRASAVRVIATEAEILGITAGGALAPASQVLLEIPDPSHTRTQHSHLSRRARPLQELSEQCAPAAATMAESLPPQVEQVIVQADLTITVPGPTGRDLARFLRLVADPESRGVARVLRISPASLRRALDSGASAASLTQRFTRWSQTGIPQPLAYLIDEAARRHAVVRAGPAASYLRSEDTAELAAIVADPRLAGLELRLLAPTVAVSSAEHDEVEATLARAGHGAVLEGPEGQVLRAGAPRRATQAVTVGGGGWRERASLAEVVPIARELARGAADQAAGAGAVPMVPDTSPAELLAAIHAALGTGTGLWITYADRRGQTETLAVHPIEVHGGILRAGRTDGTLDDFQLARIAGAIPE